MTNNDIVKDLESVIDWFTAHGRNTNTAVIDISQRAIDVIERQKAEIERLKSMNQSKLDIIHDVRTDLETAKSEAIREFVEKLKERTFECDVSQGYGRPCYEDVVTVIEIDNLVAEMMESEEQ
jgi:hypothetical protein